MSLPMTVMTGAESRGELDREVDLSAPDLVDVETVAVLRKRRLAETITEGRFASAVADLGDLALDR